MANVFHKGLSAVPKVKPPDFLAKPLAILTGKKFSRIEKGSARCPFTKHHIIFNSTESD